MSGEENVYDEEFLSIYLNLMGDVWQSKDEEARLLLDPTAYAAEKGLPVAEGSIVELDRSQPDGLLHGGDAISDWTRLPGKHILHVPADEIIDAEELCETELEMIGAGVDAPAPNNNNNACIVVIIL
jgi:hypothetical protein